MLKQFIQRGKRGFSDDDLWDAGNFICNIIPDALETLAKTDKMGYPVRYSEMIDKMYPNINSESKSELAINEWNKDILKIVKCFREYTKNESSEEFEKYWAKLGELCDNDLEKMFNYNDETNEEFVALKKAWIEKEEENDKYKKEQLKEGFKLLEENIEELWW